MNALFEDEGFQEIEGVKNAAESIPEEKEGNAKGYDRFLKVV